MENFTQNLHIITAKVIDCTDYSGKRIVLRSKRFKQSVTLNWKSGYNNGLRDQAVEFLKAKGFNILGAGTFDDITDIIVTDTFESLKDQKYIFDLYAGNEVIRCVSVFANSYNKAVSEMLLRKIEHDSFTCTDLL